MSTTPRIAPRILERDHYTCQFCGAELGDEGVAMTIDHITPTSWFARGVVVGDPDVRTNLVAACSDCNSYKRDMNLEIFAEYLRLGHGWTVAQVTEMVARVKAAVKKRLPR